MFKKISILVFVFLVLQNVAQTDTAFLYYEEGLKAFNTNQYKKADSLYTISLQIKMHPDSYYNRALSRLALGDKQGYCEDICSSATMGDRECDTIFRSECGSADTAYFDAENRSSNHLNYAFYSVVYQSDYPKANFIVKFNKKGKAIDVRSQSVPPLPGGEKEVLPEFKGGVAAMADYLKANTKIPLTLKTKKIAGQVVVKFVVNRLGYLENIRLGQTLVNCPECDKEAIRVVASMPRWKPGVHEGKTAKSDYNLPVNFKATP